MPAKKKKATKPAKRTKAAPASQPDYKVDVRSYLQEALNQTHDAEEAIESALQALENGDEELSLILDEAMSALIEADSQVQSAANTLPDEE